MLGTYLIPMALSFLIGSFGYILFYFWVRPVWHYRRVKRRVLSVIAPLTHTPVKTSKEWRRSGGIPKERKRLLNKQAADLTTCYNERLPDWYRLLIRRRGESPLEAAKFLTTMANTQDPEHSGRQAEKIRKALGAD